LNPVPPSPPEGVLSTQDLARREAWLLAPSAMHACESRGRVHDEATTAFRGSTRGLYQRDRDRIIHCTAFRRLEYKTQVFVNHEGDNFRTRLTHTLEVAQISRGIARALRLNEDLTEAVALAHDLGHTPFGHAGEDALRELLADHGGFEHNVHGLRIVDRLERRYPNFPGLNLTYEVRECIAKHATRHDHPPISEFDPEREPLLEGQVVDAADEIAYDNHDVEDGLLMGILTVEQLDGLELWREAVGRAESSFAGTGADVQPSQVLTFLINTLAMDLLTHSIEQIRDAGVASSQDVRTCGRRLIAFSPEMRRKKSELEKFLLTELYQDYRVTRMTNKAKRFLIELFDEYVRDPSQLHPDDQARIEEETAAGLHADQALYRVVCDYIAGMTDRFAQDEYKRFFYPFERV
jgi:dGTPase